VRVENRPGGCPYLGSRPTPRPPAPRRVKAAAPRAALNPHMPNPRRATASLSHPRSRLRL